MTGDATAVSGDLRAVLGVVPRPRLHALLDAHRPQVCVLRAASGSGKTTLLRGWAITRSDPAPLLWVTFNSPVASPAAFWTRLVDAAHRAGDVSVGTSTSLAEQVARSSDPVTVAIDFLTGGGPGIFVLDAYEKVGDAIEQIDRDLLRLTEALPQVRVIVAARGRTTLTADGLRLRDRVHVIGDGDLAFTAEEAVELLRVHLDQDDTTLAASVVAATHGYALAVRALVLAMSSRRSIPAVGSEEWRQLVATDLRAALPDDAAARFVAATSVPPYFDAALAGHLTGRGDVDDVLAEMERQGFGRWIPYARSHPVFQYVDSIRDAFVSELRRVDDGREYLRTASVTAMWLFEYGDHDTAFDMALEARDYSLATRIYVDLLRVNPECYLTDRLIGPLSSIPIRELKQHPMLAFALGLARMTSPVLRALAPEAFALSVGTRARGVIVGPDVDRFINASVRTVSLRLIGRFADSARSSRVALAAAEALPVEGRDDLGEVISMILRQLSYSLLQGGVFELAVATMYRSAGLTKVSSTRNCALAYATGAHAYIGELAAARAAREQIDRRGWPIGAELSYLNAMTVIGEGFLQLDDHDFQGAWETIAGAEAYTATGEFWPFFTLVAAHAQLGLGQPLSMARRIEALLHGAVPPPGAGENTATRALLNVQAIGWLAGERIAKAERVLAGVPAAAAEVVPARVLHLILTDRSTVALERLHRWLALPRHTYRSRAATLALAAAAAARTGNDRLALTLSAHAGDLHAAHGLQAHLTFVPAADRRRLAEIAGRAGDAATAAHFGDAAVDVVPVAVAQVLLGDKELAVLSELTRTSSREQIAVRLGVSVNTVKTQLRSIYRKLGVSNRAAAIHAAAEYELFDLLAEGSADSR